MAITNSYLGFEIATPEELSKVDLDSDFGDSLNRSISNINRNYAVASGISNTYAQGYVNQFGSSANFSTNEQRLVQNMVRESINVNGITVRYMPRWGKYTDNVFNERPESVFAKGLMMDMILVAASGFEGEGDVMTQYGIEFREEVVFTVAINNFESLYNSYESTLDADALGKYARSRPLEGDLVVVPFGRSAQNKNSYTPKVFEILRVTTYHDGAFFQLGDNYQYKIHARLFELSGEDFEFNPSAQKYNKDGTEQIPVSDSDSGAWDSESKIGRALDGIEFTSDDTRAINIPGDSDFMFDSWGDNLEIEEAAQVQVAHDESETIEKNPLLVNDYTSKAHGVPGVINDLDDI